MTEQWQKLKETITELRENCDTGTQQEVCKFLADLMNLLEEPMEDSNEWIPVSKRAIVAMLEKLVDCIISEPEVKSKNGKFDEKPNDSEKVEEFDR